MILTRLWQRVLSGRQFQSEKDYAQDLGSSSGVKMWWVSWSQAASAYRKCWHTVKANIIRPPCFHSCLFIFMPGTTMVNLIWRIDRKENMEWLKGLFLPAKATAIGVRTAVFLVIFKKVMEKCLDIGTYIQLLCAILVLIIILGQKKLIVGIGI